MFSNSYMKPLVDVISRYRLQDPQYADDIQLYLTIPYNPEETVDILNRCLEGGMGWMRATELKLNPNNKDVLLVRSKSTI